MHRMLRHLPYLFALSLGACFPYPAQVVERLQVRVVDALTGQPLGSVNYLRIVCDVHDMACHHALINTGRSADGHITLPGRRDWGPWTPVPGGLPVPNHQIAIWKPGYEAFVFSQYDDDIDRFADIAQNPAITRAVAAIPAQREYLHSDAPGPILQGGVIRLRPLSMHARPAGQPANGI